MVTADPFSIPPDEAVSRLLARLPRPARLLVAVSGGSDSIGLLQALANGRQDGIELFAATVDHRLRPESAAEALHVADICRALGIPHVIRNWEGDKPSSGIAAAAREARYRLLCEAADEVGATAILTGHTVDDQVETVTMRAARNSQPDTPGLAGMAEAVLLHRRHWLLRPLLRTRRADVRSFLQSLGRGWIDDPSNVDIRSERARTRQNLGGEAVSPAAIDAAASHRAAISEAAARLLSMHAQVHHSVLMHIDADAFRADPMVLRYLLSVSAAVLGGREQGLAADNLQRILSFCRVGEPGRMTAGRVVFDFRRTGLFLCRERRGIPALQVAPCETANWDGRFRVANTSNETVSLLPVETTRQEAIEQFPAVPASVALRASQVMPYPVLAGGELGSFSCKPILAPFDRFLPQFDLTFAAALAKLFGCDGFPTTPFGDSIRKR